MLSSRWVTKVVAAIAVATAVAGVSYGISGQ